MLRLIEGLLLAAFVLGSWGCVDVDIGAPDFGSCAGTLESCRAASCCAGHDCFGNVCVPIGTSQTDASAGWSFWEERRSGDCAQSTATCVNGHPDSETRLVEHDGRLIIRRRGGESSERQTTLSSEDLERITAVIESEAFQQAMTDGFGCANAMSEQRFDFGLHLDRNTYSSSANVTDCIQAETPNQPQELHAILAAY